MNILVRQFTWAPYFNQLWAQVKRVGLAKAVQCESQIPTAMSLRAMFGRRRDRADLYTPRLATSLLQIPALMGAHTGNESRMALPFDPTATVPVDCTGANSADFHVFDFFSVTMIGIGWVVAATATKLVMDFDYYTGMADAVGTATDKLDGTNGVLTVGTIADQAIGNVHYKDIGHTVGPIDLNPGSIRAIVTTTVTSGTGVPFVLGIPRAQTPGNLSRMIASA